MIDLKKAVFNSKLLRFAAFIIGFFMIYVVVWQSYYRKWNGLVLIFVLFFTGAMMFTAAAVWFEEKKGFFLKRLVKTDSLFLLATVALSFAIGYKMRRFRTLPPEIISFIAYTCSYFLMITVTAHIKEKSLFKSFCFWEFCKSRRKDRVFASVVTLAAISLLSIYAALTVPRPDFWFTFAVSYAAFAAVCYLCYYLTTLSDLYKKAVDDGLKSERMKIELISNVSHDLRTPLTSIINYIDLIKRLGIENPTLSEYIGVLEKKSRRMKTLAGDLVDASRAGSGDIKLTLERIDLAELTGQVAGDFDSLMIEAGLTFLINQEKVIIKADGEHLWRVMENVFANAVKYSLPGTRVYCFVGVLEGKAVFSLKNVSRDPLNISPETLTERFVRGDVSRTDEGSGLGLYIAKALAELMGAEFIINISGDLFEARVEFNEQ